MDHAISVVVEQMGRRFCMIMAFVIMRRNLALMQLRAGWRILNFVMY